MERSTTPLSDAERRVLHQLQDEHTERVEPALAVELVELTSKLDNDTLLHLYCEAETFLNERNWERAVSETDPELQAKILRLEAPASKLCILIEVMPQIDRSRAIKLYERGLDNELEYRKRAGMNISMHLDSLGMSEETSKAWQNALLSDQPATAACARASYDNIMHEQGLLPSNVPRSIRRAYSLSRRNLGVTSQEKLF